MGNGKYNHLPASMKFKSGNSRLTTSHSYSDLHDAALRSYYAGSAHQQQQQQQQQSQPQHQQQQHMTAGSMHDAMFAAAAAAAADNLEISCPQYQQHGFCVLDSQCPYSHNAALSQPPLMDHSTTAAAAAAAAAAGGLPPPHPLGLPALPLYSSLYQQYAMLNNLTPNASPAFSMKAAAAAAALLSANLAPGQRLPTDIRPTGSGNNNSGSANGSRRTSQATVPTAPNDEASKFAGARLEEFRGKIYDLCKDQNGCRFLQKKLEEPNRQQLELIFEEVQPHFVELMTGIKKNYTVARKKGEQIFF